MDILFSRNTNVKKDMELEYAIIKDLVSFNNSISYVDYRSMAEDTRGLYKNHVPIGNLTFVQYFLREYYDIEHLYPLEVPDILRKDKYLKRKYQIMLGKDIPKIGRYFVKGVDTLKDFSYSGDIMDLKHHAVVDANTLYQVSDEVDIISEYRVYVFNRKIVDIAFYNGDVTVFPDINLIKEMVALVSMQEDLPISYSLDIMVTKLGTSIVEMHNFIAVGLYSTLWGSDLLFAYKDGIDYAKKHNQRLTEYKG